MSRTRLAAFAVIAAGLIPLLSGALLYGGGRVERTRIPTSANLPSGWEAMVEQFPLPPRHDLPEQILAARQALAFERALKSKRLAALQEGAGEQISATRGFDALHYDLDLWIDPAATLMGGTVTLTAESVVDSLLKVSLDFYDNMAINAVTLLGPPDLDAAYSRQSNILTINLPRKVRRNEVFKVAVDYSGRPSSVGFGSFTFREHQGDPIVSTLSEPRGARTWWPCKDEPSDKAFSDVAITVPHPLIAVSNGALQRVTANDDGTRTYWWKETYPISTYLVSVAVSNYKTFSDTYYPVSGKDPMPVEYFVYKEHFDAAVEDFSVTVPMLSLYSSLFGEYPFVDERYGMAVFPWGGAMEHQTCTSYGAALVRGDHRYDLIVAHELAHQWWGDLVTLENWSNIWLNEGFASWSEALWAQHAGTSTYRGYLLSQDPRGYFTGSLYANPNEFGSTVYDKGSWVVHMLRGVMGEDAFWAAMDRYTRTYGYGNATSDQLRKVCEQELGAPLDWFFEQWVYGMNRPEYVYSWQSLSNGPAWDLILVLRQTQQNAPIFTMPVQVLVETAAGPQRFTVFNDAESQKYHFILSAEPTSVVLDPDDWILKFASPASAPDMDVNGKDYPSPLNLGSVRVGDDSVVPIPIESRGGSDLVVQDVLVWQWGRPGLSVFNKDIFPLTIPPGTTSLAFKLRFSPRQTGWGGATLEFVSNDESPDYDGTPGRGRYYVPVIGLGTN